jgi:MFS family permease
MVSMASSAGPQSADTSWVAPTSLRGARLTALLIFTQIPNVLAYTIALPLLAGMAHELAHDPGSAYLAKLVSGILGPAMTVGALLGGWLASKYDRRPLIIGIGVIYLLAAIAPAFLSSLGLIVATRFAVGLASCALYTIGTTMVGDYLPEEKRAGTLGMLSALNMVTSVASLPVAGWIGTGGWRLPFLLYLMATPVVLLALPSSLPIPVRTATQVGGRATGGIFGGAPFGLLFLALAVGIILAVPGIYISFHLATFGLGKTSTVGMLMMINSAIAAGTSAMFGRIWRASPKLLFCLAFSTMGVGLVLLALASGYALVVPAMVLMGTGMGLMAPCVMAKVVDTIGEENRGKVVGIAMGITSIAPLLAVTAFEPLLPMIGTLGLMLGIGVFSLAMFVWFAVQRQR